MSQDPKEAWRRLQQTLASAQQQGRKGLGGNPRGAIGGAAGLLLLLGGAVVVNNALFNGLKNVFYDPWFHTNALLVDGGHRAIKYTRIGGVQKEIFNEGRMIEYACVLEE